jgi:hypothetical protein
MENDEFFDNEMVTCSSSISNDIFNVMRSICPTSIM